MISSGRRALFVSNFDKHAVSEERAVKKTRLVEPVFHEAVWQRERGQDNPATGV